MRSNTARPEPLLILGCAAALSALLLSASCASGGALSERELAASRAWKPTRQGTRSALIVMDMQVANMPIVNQRTVVANIGLLVKAADESGSPVVWIYDNDEGSRPGQAAFELISELAPAPGHIRLTKTGTNAFSGNDLEATLEALGVGRLVFAGVYSDQCVRRSVEAAYFSGWRVAVASDAHSLPLSEGKAEAIGSMNARWKADRRVELAPSARISF